MSFVRRCVNSTLRTVIQHKPDCTSNICSSFSSISRGGIGVSRNNIIYSSSRSLSTESSGKKETKKEKNEASKAAKAAASEKKSSGEKKMSTDEIEAQVNDMEETEWMQEFLDKAEEVGRKKIPIPEDKAKVHFDVGREYNRQTTIRDNLYNKDITDKIWLQQDAIRALPPKLLSACLVIDDTPPPEEHVPAIFTMPPNESFDYTKYIDSQEIPYEDSTLSKS